MWIQFLLPFLVAAGSIPILGWGLEKSFRKRFMSGNELTVGTVEERPSIEASPWKSAKAQEPTQSAKGINQKILDAGRNDFKSSLSVLEKRALENSDHNIHGYISGLLKELNVLSTKIELNGIDQKARLTYAKYLPMVQKISELTASNYYGDFVRNPDHWDNPRQMRVQVELSVLAVAQEAAEDIRRLNSDQQLDFKVSVESLIGKVEEEAEEEDGKFLEELLEGPQGKLGEIRGGLEGLTQTVQEEATRLKERQKRESDEAEAIAAEAKRKKIQAGSQKSREFEEKNGVAVRPLIIERKLFKQKLSIYGPKSSENNHLAHYLDEITGESKWESFKSALQAADWVDKIVRREEAKHDYKHDCVYCRSEDE